MCVMVRKFTQQNNSVSLEQIGQQIYFIRGEKVMLDFDLAKLYQVPTFRLNEAVKRNESRFPEDFMFQLTKEELKNWISQFAISNPGTKMGLRRPPYAFTEHGVVMLSSVLKSDRATQMNLFIVRVFIKMRDWLTNHKDLAYEIEKIKRVLNQHGENLDSLNLVLKQLINPPPKPKHRIGFVDPDEK
jgi:hypothetical protein